MADAISTVDKDDLWLEPLESCKGTNESLDETDIAHELTPSPPLSRIGLNTDKAGMEGLDKSKINQIIVEDLNTTKKNWSGKTSSRNV